MRVVQDAQVIKQITTAIVCDRCDVRYDSADSLERQEMVSLDGIGGYGSVWGDGNAWEIDLCQRCANECFGNYVRLTGNEYD